MDFLYFLESIRNPVLDAIMGAITYLGDEVAFLAVHSVLHLLGFDHEVSEEDEEYMKESAEE